MSRALAERSGRTGPDRQASEVGHCGVASAVADVVGVAGDVVDGKLGEPPIMHIYVPFAEAVDPPGGCPSRLVRRMTVAAVTDRTPPHSSAPMRAASLALDPALAGGRHYDDGAGHGGCVGAAAISTVVLGAVARRAAACSYRPLRDARVRRRAGGRVEIGVRLGPGSDALRGVSDWWCVRAVACSCALRQLK